MEAVSNTLAHLVHSKRPHTSYTDEEAWQEVETLMQHLNHSSAAHAIAAAIESDDLSISITVQQALCTLRGIAKRQVDSQALVRSSEV